MTEFISHLGDEPLRSFFLLKLLQLYVQFLIEVRHLREAGILGSGH